MLYLYFYKSFFKFLLLILICKNVDHAHFDSPIPIQTTTSGSYSSVGWSNRRGSVLTPVAIPGVYTACRPFLWNTIDVGCRMTVIELSSSSMSTTTNAAKPNLLIHSPVLLDRPLINALKEIGTVKHIISPNYEHVKYAKAWGEYYKDAYMWACPSMMEREPNVNWTAEIPYGCRPANFKSNVGETSAKSTSSPKLPHEAMYDFWYEVQPLHFDVEVNPFTGKPFFNEVVFYHTESKTLLTTDTYWNYPSKDGIPNSQYESLKMINSSNTSGEKSINSSNQDKMEELEEDFGAWALAPKIENVPLKSRLWKFGMDQLFRPFYLNLMVEREKKSEFQRIAMFLSGGVKDGDVLQESSSLNDSSPWDIETIIPAHGDIVRGRNFTKTILRQHFNLVEIDR